jgi:hypothetical protein
MLTCDTPPPMRGPLTVHQPLIQSMCWKMLGCVALSQPMRLWGLCTPTSCRCGCVLLDTQPGRAELEGWPVPQGASSPSGPGGEGDQG